MYSLRLDHNFTNNNRLTLRAASAPATRPASRCRRRARRISGRTRFRALRLQNYHDWTITGQDQWTIGNNKINELRFQYARRGLLYRLFARRRAAATSRSTFPASRSSDASHSPSCNRTEQRYQLTDNFSWSKGTHNIKFGVDSNFIPVAGRLHRELRRHLQLRSAEPGIRQPGHRASTRVLSRPSIQCRPMAPGFPSNFIQGVGNPHDSFSNTTLGGFRAGQLADQTESDAELRRAL